MLASSGQQIFADYLQAHKLEDARLTGADMLWSVLLRHRVI